MHLEAKLKKANESLELQKKMTKHYAKKSRFSCAKLKEALLEVKILKREMSIATKELWLRLLSNYLKTFKEGLHQF